MPATWYRVILLGMLPALAAPQQQPHHEKPAQPQVLAPGYSALKFPPPAAGTYSLPALGKAADGKLLEPDGSPTTLHSLYDDKTAVLSFIYTSCPDVNGCPLATFVLSQIQDRLAASSRLVDQVRLITVSFDPLNDSPAVMASYARGFADGAVDWRFLTAASHETLAPILANYDQAVIRDVGPDGQPVGTMSHILRVFLIDQDKNIRNIYSPSYLHPDILLADIQTVSERYTP